MYRIAASPCVRERGPVPSTGSNPLYRHVERPSPGSTTPHKIFPDGPETTSAVGQMEAAQ
jgi:hypothetical protein